MWSAEPGSPPKYAGRSCILRAMACHASHSRAAWRALRLVQTNAPSILASRHLMTSGRRYASRGSIGRGALRSVWSRYKFLSRARLAFCKTLARQFFARVPWCDQCAAQAYSQTQRTRRIAVRLGAVCPRQLAATLKRQNRLRSHPRRIKDAAARARAVAAVGRHERSSNSSALTRTPPLR